MKIEDFNKLVISMFGMFIFGILLPMLIGSVFDYFLPHGHFGLWLTIMVWIGAIILIIAKKKEKNEIPGPGDETPWENDNIQDGGKI